MLGGIVRIYMNKRCIPWLIAGCLALVLIGCFIHSTGKKEASPLTPNWNFSSATGPNLYQQLANSFVFVIKRTPGVESWQTGDYRTSEYALFVIQRGTGSAVCPAYSALSIQSSALNLDPYVGKAVLVTSFVQPDKQAGAITIERLELDTAVNEKLQEYRQACPTPFQKIDELLGRS